MEIGKNQNQLYGGAQLYLDDIKWVRRAMQIGKGGVEGGGGKAWDIRCALGFHARAKTIVACPA
jgi:hypothetical protein